MRRSIVVCSDDACAISFPRSSSLGVDVGMPLALVALVGTCAVAMPESYSNPVVLEL